MSKLANACAPSADMVLLKGGTMSLEESVGHRQHRMSDLIFSYP